MCRDFGVKFGALMTLLTGGLLALFASLGQAADLVFRMDTSEISSSSVLLTFEFLDGGPASNAIEIHSFQSDGTLLGEVELHGEASGSLSHAVFLSDSGDTSFFNQYTENFVVGTSLVFSFHTTNNAPLGVPDGFAFFFLDERTRLPFFSTSDPTGSDALFLLSIDGSERGKVEVFNSVSALPVTWSISAVPESSQLLLWTAGLSGMLSFLAIARIRG